MEKDNQTGQCVDLNDLLGEETADISPEDAGAGDQGNADGEAIRVNSRRGNHMGQAKVTRQVPRGLVWMAFDFRVNCANWLTHAAFDPVTLTAEYKACAVRIHKNADGPA